MRRGLRSTLRAVLAVVSPSLAAARKASAAERAKAAAALQALTAEGWAVVLDPTQALLNRLAQRGAQEAVLKLGVGTPLFLEEPNREAADYARDRAAELIGMRQLPDGTVVPNPDPTYSITEATRDMVQEAVAQAFEEGWSLGKLRDELATHAAFSDERAALIARTEVVGALVQGNLAGWRASGVVTGKEWVLGSEHDVDDECDDNVADGVIGLEEAFASGDDGPPAHPRCVCDILPVTEDEESPASEE